VEEKTPWAGDEGQNVVVVVAALFDSVGSAMASLAVAFVLQVIVWET
jgi:hypothetical protein